MSRDYAKRNDPSYPASKFYLTDPRMSVEEKIIIYATHAARDHFNIKDIELLGSQMDRLCDEIACDRDSTSLLFSGPIGKIKIWRKGFYE